MKPEVRDLLDDLEFLQTDLSYALQNKEADEQMFLERVREFERGLLELISKYSADE